MAQSIDDFFRYGSSLSSSDVPLFEEVKEGLKELDLENKRFQFLELNEPKFSKYTTGKVRIGNIVTELTKDITPLVISNKSHRNVESVLGFNLDDSKGMAVTKNPSFDEKNSKFAESLDELLKREGLSPTADTAEFIKSRGSIGQAKLLILNQEIFNQNQFHHPMRIALHEYGHFASNRAGLYGLVDEGFGALHQLASDPMAGDIDYEAGYFKYMRARALEEARAETFSYSLISKTKIGQQISDDLLKQVGSTESADFISRFADSISYYGVTEKSWKYYLKTAMRIAPPPEGLEESLRVRGKMEANVALLRSIGFGDLSENFNPLIEKLIQHNRNLIKASPIESKYLAHYDKLLEDKYPKFGIEIIEANQGWNFAKPSAPVAEIAQDSIQNLMEKEAGPSIRVASGKSSDSTFMAVEKARKMSGLVADTLGKKIGKVF